MPYEYNFIYSLPTLEGRYYYKHFIGAYILYVDGIHNSEAIWLKLKGKKGQTQNLNSALFSFQF
jgi:hypothetical protein